MELITIENNSEPKNIKSIQKINDNINRKTPIVIYFYMEGCPYCVTTTNEWNKIPNHINRDILNDELLAVRINHILFNLLNNVGKQPQSFPTIRYVNSDSIAHYDKEGEERNAQNLARWIEEKHSKNRSFISPKTPYSYMTKKSIQPSYQSIQPSYQSIQPSYQSIQPSISYVPIRKSLNNSSRKKSNKSSRKSSRKKSNKSRRKSSRKNSRNSSRKSYENIPLHF